MRSFKWILSGMMGLAIAAGCTTYAADKDAAKGKTAMAHVMGAGDNKDKISGHLEFHEVADGVHVTGEIKGLTPGKHGFHIHEKGDLSDPALKSAGGHFNPGKHKHGGPDSSEHHAGDFGNITADEKGVAKVDATFKGVSIGGADNGIVGRSVIVHAKEDDMKSDPAGNAGDRIAGGKIEEGK